MKVNNHYFPRFHIKKWESQGGKIFDKSTGNIRSIKRLDFSEPHFYTENDSDELENRIAVFETVIGEIIKKVDESVGEVTLSGRELFYLKLYVILFTYRHNHTTEVIRSDEADVYRSNNYLFGVKRITTREGFISSTKYVMDLFEKVQSDKDFKHLESFSQIIMTGGYPESHILHGLHLVILRPQEVTFCVSDVCSIIENTMDSDHLYTFIPISPKTGLCLVKTKYYLCPNNYFHTMERFARIHNSKDEWLSEIFESNEHVLFCSYYKPYVRNPLYVKPKVSHVQDTWYGHPLRYPYDVVKNSNYCTVEISIKTIDDDIARRFNSIFFEDGKLFMFCNKSDFEHAKKNRLAFRDIKIYSPFI